jgi:HEAT repeat protein
MLNSGEYMKMVVGVRHAAKYDKKFESELIDLINHEYYELRANAALSLAKINSTHIAEKIAELLEDEVEEVRYSAAEALGSLLVPSTIGSLLDALDDYSRETRRQIELALSKFESSILQPEVMLYLEQITPSDYDMADEESIHRVDVVRGIIEISSSLNTWWVDQILDFGLTAPDLEMQRLACISIGRMKRTKFQDKILDLIDHEDDDLRLAASYALIQMDIPDKLAFLVKFSDDQYEFIRELTAANIGDYEDDPRSYNLLHKLCKDPVFFVRKAVANSLRYFRSDFELFDTLADDVHGEVRIAMARTLGEINSDETTKKLEEMLLQETDDLVLIAIRNALDP